MTLYLRSSQVLDANSSYGPDSLESWLGRGCGRALWSLRGKEGGRHLPSPIALGPMGRCDGEVVDGGETLQAGLFCRTEKGGLMFLLKERGWGRPLPHFLISPARLTLS